MKTGEIGLLYEHAYWADGRILAASAKASPQQYMAPGSCGLGHGSLRATLIHIVDSEWQ